MQIACTFPAGQHFGFDGRLSRRTNLRLYTFSFFFIFPYCSYFSFDYFFIFSYFLLVVIISLFEVLIFNFNYFSSFFELFSRSLVLIALLNGCPGLMMLFVNSSGTAIPHLQALILFCPYLGVPCPSFCCFP